MSSINSLNIKSQDYIISGFTEIIICSTQASTIAKTATAPDAFNLDTNASFKIKFTNGNSANQPTLNLNDTGDKNLVGTNGTNLLVANQIYDCHYDGTQYVINNSVDIVNSVESGNMSPVTSNAVANWQPTSFTVGDIHMGINNNIYADGTKACHSIIRFIDNTTDTAGNGVVIGGGGAVIIGGGESANVYRTGASVTGGNEVMVITNDTSIEFVTNLDGGYACKKSMTMGSDGKLTNSQGFVGNLTGNASYATSAGSATTATCATKDGSGCTFGTAARYSCDCFVTPQGSVRFANESTWANTSYRAGAHVSFSIQKNSPSYIDLGDKCIRFSLVECSSLDIRNVCCYGSLYIETECSTGGAWTHTSFDNFDYRVINLQTPFCTDNAPLLYGNTSSFVCGSCCIYYIGGLAPTNWVSGYRGFYRDNHEFSGNGWTQLNCPIEAFTLQYNKCREICHPVGIFFRCEARNCYQPIVEIKVYN